MYRIHTSLALSPELFSWFPAPIKATEKSKQDTFTGVTLKTSSTYQAHFGARATDTQTEALRLGAGVASTENRVEHEHRGLGVR